MATSKVTSVVVAIDTESYAGNFERNMCAFITGEVGECGVGEELIEEAQEELAQDTINNTGEWIFDHIVHEADDSESPCHRPCSIWPTPGWFNGGMGGHYRDIPDNEEQALNDLYKSLVAYHASQLEMVNSRIENNDFEEAGKSGAWDKDACVRTKEHIEKTLAEAKAKTKADKWPAYMSVAIFFDEVPPKEVVDVIIERAKRFAADRPDWRDWKGEKEPLNITRVRVLEPKLIKPCQIEHVEVARYEV